MQKIKHSKYSVLARSAFSLITARELNKHLPKYPNLVFIWVPKTAGTAVYKALNKTIGMQRRKQPRDFLSFPGYGPITFGHVSYNDLICIGAVSEQYNKNALKFAFTRCPYDRAISLFSYLKQQKKIDGELEFESFLELVHLKRPPIGMHHAIGLSQANPQMDWLTGIDGELLVNRLFKFEKMEVFEKFFTEQFGLSINMKEQKNQSHRLFNLADLRKHHAARELIELIYARDFDALNYPKL